MICSGFGGCASRCMHGADSSSATLWAVVSALTGRGPRSPLRSRAGSAQKPHPKGLQHGLVLVDTTELVHRVVDVEHGGALADAEDVAHLPGRLALHGPAEGFEFAWGERRDGLVGRGGH